VKRNYYIIISFIALLATASYLFLPTYKSGSKEKKPVAVEATTQAGFNIEDYLKKVNTTFTTDTQSLLGVWQQQSNFDALTTFYHAKGESVAEAYYTLKGAKEVSAYKRAGSLFQATAAISNTPEMSGYLIDKAVEAYQQAFDLDTTNVEIKMQLASAYIEQGSGPMRGITMLLDIVAKDPANADAQLLLGKFAMMSNQFEKAVQRLEKVLSLRPQSNDALFLLAVAYQNMGNKTKALELLEKCKNNEKSIELKQEIEKYIRQVKET
jgi:thioredoxin-like negative regulator of GroEL